MSYKFRIGRTDLTILDNIRWAFEGAPAGRKADIKAVLKEDVVNGKITAEQY